MKKISLYFVLLIAFASIGAFFLINNPSKADDCCAHGRCTGNINCHICTNCSRCAHCNSGGSCGVCASYTKPKPKASSKSYSNPKDNESSATDDLKASDGISCIVNSSTLNIREEPSKDAKIIVTIKYGTQVSLLEIIDEEWVKVMVSGYTGYAFKQYLTTKK